MQIYLRLLDVQLMNIVFEGAISAQIELLNAQLVHFQNLMNCKLFAQHVILVIILSL